MKLQKLLLLSAMLILLLSACGEGEEQTPAATEPSDEATAEPVDEATAEPVDEATPEAAEGLFNGMTAEELMAEGYVVIAPGEPIRIGVSAALTGPIPEPGKDIANAAEVAAAVLNEEGGIEGHDIELVIEDGACDGDQGTIVGNKFAADPTILAVSGGTCSGETFGLTPILQEARIPFVSPSATNPNVTSEECDICNRVALSDALQGQVDAEFVFNELELTSVAVMHDNSDYGLGLADVFKANFEELGGTVVAFEGIQVGDTDFRPVLTQIASEEPELIFFGGYAAEAGLITAQMQEVGLEDAYFMSDDGSYSQQYLDTAGDASEEVFMSFVAGDEIEELNEEFDARYEEMFNVAPDDLGPFHGQSYDSVMLIAAAIRSVAHTDDAGEGYLIISREELIAAIRGTTEMQGLTGLLSCTAIGECGAGGIQVFQVIDGEFEQIYGFGLDE